MKKNTKKIIFYFVMLFSLTLILFYGAFPTHCEGANLLGDIDDLAGTTGLPDQSIEEIFINFMEWALRIFGILAIIAFIISGTMYLTSIGDEEKIKNAKKAMKWSIIGVLVGLSGVIVIETIELFLE